jgi:hypothetical protein
MDFASRHWEDAKVLLKDEVLEVRNVNGSLHVARKERHSTNETLRSSLATPTD